MRFSYKNVVFCVFGVSCELEFSLVQKILLLCILMLCTWEKKVFFFCFFFFIYCFACIWLLQSACLYTFQIMVKPTVWTVWRHVRRGIKCLKHLLHLPILPITLALPLLFQSLLARAWITQDATAVVTWVCFVVICVLWNVFLVLHFCFVFVFPPKTLVWISLCFKFCIGILNFCIYISRWTKRSIGSSGQKWWFKT